MEMKNISLKASDTVSGAIYEGTYHVPCSLADKAALYGEEVVNSVFESKVKAALGHKCRVALQRGKETREINLVVAEWKPTLKTMGKITEEKIKKELDPLKRKEMIEKKVSEILALTEL